MGHKYKPGLYLGYGQWRLVRARMVGFASHFDFRCSLASTHCCTLALIAASKQLCTLLLLGILVLRPFPRLSTNWTDTWTYPANSGPSLGLTTAILCQRNGSSSTSPGLEKAGGEHSAGLLNTRVPWMGTNFHTAASFWRHSPRDVCGRSGFVRRPGSGGPPERK